LIIDHWSFGGATAMMLQINHRESHDVIFLQDPQLLPFLDPQRHDFKFDIVPSDYIVDQPKTAEPTFEHVIEGERILLETVPEIIAKKIVHRGASIKPRDIFDIAAAGDTHAQSIIAALRPYKNEVAETTKRLERLNPVFVSNAISELQIREQFRPVAAGAMERSKEILRAALQST
jgi:hypothetical protein